MSDDTVIDLFITAPWSLACLAHISILGAGVQASQCLEIAQNAFRFAKRSFTTCDVYMNTFKSRFIHDTVVTDGLNSDDRNSGI